MHFPAASSHFQCFPACLQGTAAWQGHPRFCRSGCASLCSHVAMPCLLQAPGLAAAVWAAAGCCSAWVLRDCSDSLSSDLNACRASLHAEDIWDQPLRVQAAAMSSKQSASHVLVQFCSSRGRWSIQMQLLQKLTLAVNMYCSLNEWLPLMQPCTWHFKGPQADACCGCY